MKDIIIQPLGAGQEVGRSCILVRIGGKTVMFDAGLHMGFQDSRRFPYFNLISPTSPRGPFTEHIDAVIISHFHLDHCGALAYFTERLGYSGPLYMTYPTRCIAPLLLNDFQRIMASQNPNDELFFSPKDVQRSMSKVSLLTLNTEIEVAPGIFITAFYAGHVLGAVMLLLRVGINTVLYTGDFNTTPDRHLGAARLPYFHSGLNVLITESTYATVTRDSRRFREQEFLHRVRRTILRGGKVLIPVFALGRAQELAVLLDAFWQQIGLTGRVPIFLAGGLAASSNEYYRLFASWTNDNMLEGLTDQTPPVHTMGLSSVLPFRRAILEQDSAGEGPMVVLSTPGMLHAGLSLEIFRRWAGDSRNLLVIPGYCSPGTVGHRVLLGEKTLRLDKEFPGEHVEVEVCCEVANLSFSAHADAFGILSLVQSAMPEHVVLVHGDRKGMSELQARVARELGIPTHSPPTTSTLRLRCETGRDRRNDITIENESESGSKNVMVRPAKETNPVKTNVNQTTQSVEIVVPLKEAQKAVSCARKSTHIAMEEASRLKSRYYDAIRTVLREEQRRIHGLSKIGSTAVKEQPDFGEAKGERMENSTENSTENSMENSMKNNTKNKIEDEKKDKRKRENNGKDESNLSIHGNNNVKRLKTDPYLDVGTLKPSERTSLEGPFEIVHPYIASNSILAHGLDSNSRLSQDFAPFLAPEMHKLSGIRQLDGFLVNTTPHHEDSAALTPSALASSRRIFVPLEEGVEVLREEHIPLLVRLLSSCHITLSRVFIEIIVGEMANYMSHRVKVSSNRSHRMKSLVSPQNPTDGHLKSKNNQVSQTEQEYDVQFLGDFPMLTKYSQFSLETRNLLYHDIFLDKNLSKPHVILFVLCAILETHYFTNVEIEEKNAGKGFIGRIRGTSISIEITSVCAPVEQSSLLVSEIFGEITLKYDLEDLELAHQIEALFLTLHHHATS